MTHKFACVLNKPPHPNPLPEGEGLGVRVVCARLFLRPIFDEEGKGDCAQKGDERQNNGHI